MSFPKALTIAGSDCGGGAGIQADLKTFQELGAYGMSAITAVTAQNTLGVHGIYPVELAGIQAQLEAIGDDLEPDALKTGMLYNAEIIELVADLIKHFSWRNLVIDPVMTAKGGSILLQQKALRSLIDKLLPLSTVMTPNIPEAEIITNMSIRTLSEREEAARRIKQMGTRFVIIKGGHVPEEEQRIVDLVYDGQQFSYLESDRIPTRHTHGTGCTYSAALTAELAHGKTVPEAIHTAKNFIHSAIENGLGIGGGHGPTNHFAYRSRNATTSIR